MNNWYISESKIHGVGIFASKTFPPNSFIDVAINNKDIITKPFGSTINHSWTPTARLIYSKGTRTYDIYTIKQLNKGEEVTVDYTFTPDFIVKPSPHWK
jgi:SET domain-containing protein